MSLIKWILETSSQNVIIAQNVNVFSPKVLTEDTIFTSPTGEVTAILHGHPSHAKVKPLAGRAKIIPSFLRYFKTLSTGSVLEIEPATSCSAVNALHSFRMIFFVPRQSGGTRSLEREKSFQPRRISSSWPHRRHETSCGFLCGHRD